MPIILPKPIDVDDRAVAIIDVAMSIELAMTGDERVDIYDLAEEIVDRIMPPKPRIRVRAATQHTA